MRGWCWRGLRGGAQGPRMTQKWEDRGANSSLRPYGPSLHHRPARAGAYSRTACPPPHSPRGSPGLLCVPIGPASNVGCVPGPARGDVVTHLCVSHPSPALALGRWATCGHRGPRVHYIKHLHAAHTHDAHRSHLPGGGVCSTPTFPGLYSGRARGPPALPPGTCGSVPEAALDHPRAARM